MSRANTAVTLLASLGVALLVVLAWSSLPMRERRVSRAQWRR